MTENERLASWIAGLMRENYEALGFIPEPAVAEQYVGNGRVILQTDERGRRVGYLLHGSMQYGKPVSVAQHCIQTEQRLLGFGEAALRELIEKARQAGVSAITARCATELPSLNFWRNQGFLVLGEVDGGQKRKRKLARLVLPVCAPLLDEDDS